MKVDFGVHINGTYELICTVMFHVVYADCFITACEVTGDNYLLSSSACCDLKIQLE